MVNINFIHPPDFKITRDRNTETAPLPKKVILPLSQHAGSPSEPIVKPGDMVKTGSLIAQAKGFISSALHSSVSGRVIAIEDAPHPIMAASKAIIIESDGQDMKAFSGAGPVRDMSGFSGDEIIRSVRDAGIVGLGGAAFPSHVKLSPPKDKKIDTLIINGAECEPFLSCDHRLMLERPKEILFGIQIIVKALGVKEVIIGIEENKLDAIESLGTALFRVKGEGLSMKVKKLKTRYPQGGEKQLIKTLLGREVPSGGLPLDVGAVVHNVQTVFSVYEAVRLGKPLYERVITVSGSFSNQSKNVLVRIGTPIKDVLEWCGFKMKFDVHKVVMGGPMTGVAQADLEAPIIKGTSGILVLGSKFELEDKETSCVRCSRCVEACPAGIMPCMIGLAIKNDRFDIAGSYDPLDCIECGSCSYVCPSKIPLVQLIKLAKLKTKR
ncbi:MAG: electron transport complex subunit RsxC [Candidatus Omnitrophota bacterium]